MMTMTYFTAGSNLVPYAIVWEKGKIMDFSETIVVYDIKVGRFSQLNEYSETTRLIQAIFHMEPPWDVGNDFFSNVPGLMTMPIYGEKLQKSSSSEPRGR